MGMIDSHPALKAASPLSAHFGLVHRRRPASGGAFFPSQNFGFFYFFAQGRETRCTKT
jgi:hypothetical protein